MSALLSDKKEAGKMRIKNIKGPESARLLEMGLLPGTQVELIQSAPLGYPIKIKVRGYFLSLREFEAQCVEIE